MPDRRNQLTPERLSDLLGKLNEVMAEADRLRREVTRQLEEQRRASAQQETPPRKNAIKRR